MRRKKDSKIPGTGTESCIYKKNFSKTVPGFVGEKREKQ